MTDHRHLICSICFCAVPMEPLDMYAAHQRWHQTLTNQPPRGDYAERARADIARIFGAEWAKERGYL